MRGLNKNILLYFTCIFCGLYFNACSVSRPADSALHITVDKDGKGDFVTIQEAINSLPDSAAFTRVIHIRPGHYNEKIYITKHNITLLGEDMNATVIAQDIARDEWRCSNADDWGVATVNLNGNDITLRNLTIANEYGYHVEGSKTIDCPNDSLQKTKVITNGGHQMALRSMNTTRLRAVNCRFRSKAGDTVSPWNTVNGMFYFKDCIMEGGVDFYCPRGWAWAENCTFYSTTGPAAIWHDGSANSDSKTVLKNCRFDGYEGFLLGRYHRDAQFFLVDCNFSKKMSDRDIYLVPTTNTIQWGRRVYYSGCHREGGDYAWFGENLATAAGSPGKKDITVTWLFGNRWDPEKI